MRMYPSKLSEWFCLVWPALYHISRATQVYFCSRFMTRCEFVPTAYSDLGQEDLSDAGIAIRFSPRV